MTYDILTNGTTNNDLMTNDQTQNFQKFAYILNIVQMFNNFDTVPLSGNLPLFLKAWVGPEADQMEPYPGVSPRGAWRPNQARGVFNTHVVGPQTGAENSDTPPVPGGLFFGWRAV